MKQLTQKLRDGSMQVIEVPPPVPGQGMVLVKNHYSVISAGTEGSTVSAARKNLIGKAMERPERARQALDVLKQQGPVQTYRAVMKRLDSYSPLGYSSAGEVLEVAPDVKGFAPGDLVACAGAGYANHAEIVAVPANLCVKIPQGADLKNAAYNTMGAIALQGIRQADLRLGETCAVIGLGILGQLTCVMLRAAGIKVAGFDIDPAAVDTARRHSADMALLMNEPGLEDKVQEFTGDIGIDAVIITAATRSTDPVNLAGSILRKKGRVVVVGDVPTGFDREPNYYKKELELRMSCSYGPGRYDPHYEDKGLDYPVGYVRWTENRNMKAFQELVHTGRIDISFLTTHVFELDRSPQAYDLIMKREENFMGILIKYDAASVKPDKKIETGKRAAPKKVTAAFLGAGNYAMSNLIPYIAKDENISLKGVMTISGTSSRTAADKYGFEFCTSDEKDILSNSEINTVFIATRHDSHASYVIKALKAGKNVFVEKPLCLKIEELDEIAGLVDQGSPALMVGFNRRFSPLAVALKERVGTGPMAMIYRVNAGTIPADSWIQDPEIGGGRIIGEACHFIDFLTFLTGSLPKELYAAALPSEHEDSLSINLKFENGSIGNVLYLSNGSKSLEKEYLEVYQAGTTAILKDFREIRIYANGKPFRKKLMNQDKGQKAMLKEFINAVKNGAPAPIPFNEIYAVTRATFKSIESLRNGIVVRI
jgi:predicted dehydrogenase/threonine dehydrogenase-like Zn-dependent dehydrogenase